MHVWWIRNIFLCNIKTIHHKNWNPMNVFIFLINVNIFRLFSHWINYFSDKNEHYRNAFTVVEENLSSSDVKSSAKAVFRKRRRTHPPLPKSRIETHTHHTNFYWNILALNWDWINYFSDKNEHYRNAFTVVFINMNIITMFSQ
jgi:hypothetical protein